MKRKVFSLFLFFSEFGLSLEILYDNSVSESNALILGAWKLYSFADQTWNMSKSDFMFNLQNCKLFMLEKFWYRRVEYLDKSMALPIERRP